MLTGSSAHHHHGHNHNRWWWPDEWYWPETWPEKLAVAMGFLASISLGVVACIAFYTVLAWGGWPLAIITGFAAFFTEGVVYLTDMPSEFKKYCHHGFDRDLKNNYMADYLLLNKSKNYPDKKILIQAIDQYIENKRINESYPENSDFDAPATFFEFKIPSYLCLIYNYKYLGSYNSLLFSFYRKKILFYVSLLFALGSGICFGVVGFTHCTIAFTFLLGFAAAATPAWVLILASLTAFAAAFTYTMLMASSLNKLFNGGFNKFWISIKNIFICQKGFSHLSYKEQGLHILKATLKIILLLSIVAAVVLVGLASGGMLMDAASNVFVATAQLAAPIINYITTIVTWIFWIPLMVLFLLYNSWRSLQAVVKACMKLTEPDERKKMKESFLAKMPRDKRLIPFYVLGFLVAFFFFAMHVISEGALAGEGAKGEADVFSNVFLRFSEIITAIFKTVFSVILIIPEVMIAVVLSTIVEILEDLPYFASDEADEEEAHDHHSFIIAVFGATGGAIINFFSYHGLLKLLVLGCIAMTTELFISATAAWIGQASFLGISAAMAPSMFCFSVLLLGAFAVVIYFSMEHGHDHGHYGKVGSGGKDFNPAKPNEILSSRTVVLSPRTVVLSPRTVVLSPLRMAGPGFIFPDPAIRRGDSVDRGDSVERDDSTTVQDDSTTVRGDSGTSP